MITLPSLFLLFSIVNAQYTPPRRWGQATLLVNSNLYVHGGKTDQYNEQSYTQAPDSKDLLCLDLTKSFDVSSVPWEHLSDDGPAIAWHTISAVNTSLALSFGGQTDANSHTVLPDQPDSAGLLDVLDTAKPQWIDVDNPFAVEPGRRFHHTADTLPDGRVLIIGGQKTDGSGTALSEHYLFDISLPQFIPLNSTADGPKDIYGHTSTVVPGGFVVVFGGGSPSSGGLIPFTTIWVLDIKTPSPFWFSLSLNGTDHPQPRVDFASVLLPDGRILIHGGSDGSVASALGDGWFLTIDFITKTFSWTQAPGLSSLGPRRDHFAVSSGDSVIFGFGYGPNGPADAGIQIYNPNSGDMGSTHTPPSPTSSPSATLPGASGTGAGSHGHSTSTTSPTPTVTPGSGDGSDGGNGDGGDSGDPTHNGNHKKTTGIAVGVTLGILALLAAGVGTALYVRRQHRHQRFASQFRRIDENDPDDNSPHSALSHDIPAAHPYGGQPELRGRGIFKTLGLTALGVGSRMRHTPERKDMLADEDTRQFGAWTRYKDGTGGSTWSFMSALTGRNRSSREASMASANASLANTPWLEKGDPFTDGSALLRDDASGYVGAVAPTATAVAASRPSGRRHTSHTSSLSGFSYADPFADPIIEEHRDSESPLHFNNHTRDVETGHRKQPSYSDYPPLAVNTIFQGMERHALSPLSEATSRYSLSDPSNGSQSSHDHVSLATTQTNPTSYDHSMPASPKHISIVDSQSSAPTRGVARSDTWWNRFSKSSFLDRRGSNASRQGFDIRDPNPPPVRLSAIEEKSHHSASPESQKSRETPPSAISARRKNSLYNSVVHGKSSSSVRTADTAAIERMGGMDVVQRLATGSQRTRSSVGSSLDEVSIQDRNSYTGDPHLDIVASPIEVDSHSAHPGLIQVIAPVPTDHAVAPDPSPSPHNKTPSPGPSSHASSSQPSVNTFGQPSPSRSPTRRISGLISSRVGEFENRLAQEKEVHPPTNTRSREERVNRGKKTNVSYGLVPRASLFVANPDGTDPVPGDGR